MFICFVTCPPPSPSPSQYILDAFGIGMEKSTSFFLIASWYFIIIS